MYFKDFPKFLYDFKYKDSDGKTKTSLVVDVTRNIRVKKEVLENITVYDEYDIIDGETPEIISEKFYGTPYYHWIIMLTNERYDYRNDFPMPETVLQKHIETYYNPVLKSTDWYWEQIDGEVILYFKVTDGEDQPFSTRFLTEPIDIWVTDDDKSLDWKTNYPDGDLMLNETTQYWNFKIAAADTTTETEQWLLDHGTEKSTSTEGIGATELYIYTEGREHNPVYYVDNNGFEIDAYQPGAIGVSGDSVHRMENDEKRRIKIIDPSLIENVIRNFEEEL